MEIKDKTKWPHLGHFHTEHRWTRPCLAKPTHYSIRDEILHTTSNDMHDTLSLLQSELQCVLLVHWSYILFHQPMTVMAAILRSNTGISQDLNGSVIKLWHLHYQRYGVTIVTVHLMNYACGYVCGFCGLVLTDCHHILQVTSLALGQSWDFPGASEATLRDMVKYIMWITNNCI